MLLEYVLFNTILLSRPVQRPHNTVVQFSRHQYQHLVTLRHSLYPNSKTLLRSTWGKENIKMRDYYNPALRSAMMEAHDEAATMRLDFFYSTDRVSLPNIPTLQNLNNLCSRLQVILVCHLLSFRISNSLKYLCPTIQINKSPDLPSKIAKEIPDYMTLFVSTKVTSPQHG